MDERLADIYFVNVGQGDCILIHLASHEVIVVDCHRPFDRVRPPAIDLIERLAPERGGRYDIDILCLTHPDKDHYSGIVDLVEWVIMKGGRVNGLILYAPIPKDLVALVHSEKVEAAKLPASSTAAIPLELARIRRSEAQFASLYRTLIQIRESVDESKYARASGYSKFATLPSGGLFIVGPTDRIVDTFSDRVWHEMIRAWRDGDVAENESANEVSCILLVKLGEINVALLGDSTVAAQLKSSSAYREALERDFGPEIRADIVKASHHGSKTGSSEELWNLTLKKGGYVVFSAGAHRGYRHPHTETMGHVRQNNAASRFVCTNVCPDHWNGHDASDRRVEVESQLFDDQPEKLWADVEKGERGCTYHGTIKFSIARDGTIGFQPERNPDAICRWHSAGS